MTIQGAISTVSGLDIILEEQCREKCQKIVKSLYVLTLGTVKQIAKNAGQILEISNMKQLKVTQ